MRETRALDMLIDLRGVVRMVAKKVLQTNLNQRIVPKKDTENDDGH